MPTTLKTSDNHLLVSTLHSFSLIPETREIFLTTENFIDEQAMWMIRNIRFFDSLSSRRPIIIHQYSCGGDWNCGMAVFDAMITCQSPLVFICYGQAASLGSILPQACAIHKKGLRLTMEHCTWLFHEGYVDQTGTVKQMKAAARDSERQRNLLYDIYVDATHKCPLFKDRTKSDIKKYFIQKTRENEDWIMSSDEAVEHGFADYVIGPNHKYKTHTEAIRAFMSRRSRNAKTKT